jgi:hypothetical protein
MQAEEKRWTVGESCGDLGRRVLYGGSPSSIAMCNQEAFSKLLDQIDESNHSRPVGEEPEPSAINAAIAGLRAELAACVYRRASVDRLLDLLPPEGWPEPLPTMTGWEVQEAWEHGDDVERLYTASQPEETPRWERFWPTPVRADGVGCLAGSTFVARVIPPAVPPEPQTELVPWWEALGRAVPDGREIIAVGYRKGNQQGWISTTDNGNDFADESGCVRVLVSDEGDE